jgi:hypothetical protein
METEYDTGKVIGDYMNLTYNWIKSERTYFISTSMYDEIYKVAPFNPLFGQILTINDSDIFIGTIVKGFELYQDQNSNLVLDSRDEMKYFIMLNASQLVIDYPLIMEEINENHSRFSWKTTYQDVDGFFFPSNDLIKVFIDSFNLSYTFDLTASYSDLKLDMEMGDWHAHHIDFDQNTGEEILLDEIVLSNYGLSILFGTVLGSDEEIESDSNFQNDSILNSSLFLNNQLIYETYFDENYTFIESGTNYTSKTVTALEDSLYEDQWMQWNTPENLITWWTQYYPTLSDDTPIPQITNDKLLSLYRVCYPVFGGKGFIHDPRYTAYFSGKVVSDKTESTKTTDTSVPSDISDTSDTSETSETSDTQITTLSVPIIGVFTGLMLILFSHRRRKKFS